MDALVRAVKETEAWSEFDAATKRGMKLIARQCFYAPVTRDHAMFVAGVCIDDVEEKRRAVMQTAAYGRLRDKFPMNPNENAWTHLERM